MPRKRKSEIIGKYQSEVQRSLNWRRQEGIDRLWMDLLREYTAETDYEDGTDYVNVNHAFATVNVMLPSTTVNDPQITTKPNDPADEAPGKLVESLLNYQWRHFGWKRPLKLSVKDSLIFGIGWAKIGWKYVEEERLLSPDEITVRLAEEAAEADLMAEQAPMLAEKIPSDEDILRNLVAANSVVVEDAPYVERVSPFDIYVNPEATDMSNARWIAQKMMVPIEDVKANDAYAASARRKVTGGYNRYTWGEDPRADQSNSHEANNDLVLIWEFYDLAAQKMCVFADGAEDFLVKPEDMPYHFGHPFEPLRGYDVPDTFFPIGDLEMIVPLAKELNKTRRQMLEWRRKFSPKYLYRSSEVDSNAMDALMSQDDYRAISVETQRSLQDVIQPLATSPLDPNLFNWSSLIGDDIELVSGVSEYARGAAPSIRRTATEASMIQDALNARSAEKLSTVEDFVARIARKVLQLNQQFMTGKQVARILGSDGEITWEEFTRTDILGEFDFAVEAGSTQPNNETIRRQKALAMAQVLGPFVGTVVDPNEYLKHILSEGFGIRNPEKFFMQQAPPMPEDPSMMDPMMGGMPPTGGPQGVDAPQMTPPERADANVAAADQSMIEGIPSALVNQLSNQFGVRPQQALL